MFTYPPAVTLDSQYRMQGLEQEDTPCDDNYELARAASIISQAFSIIDIRNKAFGMSSAHKSTVRFSIDI
jgi:hypothetical protein